TPVFVIRGTNPYYDFLNCPTTWDLEDYRFYFDQMAKLRLNLVGFHSYDNEPFCAYEEDGQMMYGAPLATSARYGWGCVRGLETAQFAFGTGDYFHRPVFGSLSVVDHPDRDDSIRASQALLQEALHYAKGRGIKTALGFELRGDPTDEQVQRTLEARLRGLVNTYPMLDYVWLWQAEGWGRGRDKAPPGSPLDLLIQEERRHFEYLDDPRRVAEAVRMGEVIRLAHIILKAIAPDMRMGICGWGGDKHMRFTDFLPGLDKMVPGDIVFTALDNIDPTREPNVSAAYAKLSPEREKWPIPWWESDAGGRRDQWGPQPNTKIFTELCRDILSKGCQGMMSIHWRTRQVEEVAGYTARFAWAPELSYEEYYDDFASRCFGRRHGQEMSEILRGLEELGPRWTGGGGQVECGRFSWFTGNERPQEEKLARLAAIRRRVQIIRDDVGAGGDVQHLERLDYLLITMDWLAAYDEAASKIVDEVQPLVHQAEELHRQGEMAEAKARARQALRAMDESGLREAMQIYPRLITTQGDFGVLASVNVKAYASYDILWERAVAVLGEEGAPEAKAALAPKADQRVPHLVAKTPYTSQAAGAP
ncbi:MAG: hypothetical protein ACE5JM_15970, partial [Armatimonadota bacterium]